MRRFTCVHLSCLPEFVHPTIAFKSMPSRKRPPRRKPLVKRLLDGLLPRRLMKLDWSSDDSTGDDAPSATVDAAVTSSSSLLKRHKEVKKEQSSSPDPTLLRLPSPTREQGRQSQVSSHLSSNMILLRCPRLSFVTQEAPLVTANSQFFYSPMYRRYFGMTPPNPSLNNPRLLEDYIDWYINVYLEEELPWSWVRIHRYSSAIHIRPS